MNWCKVAAAVFVSAVACGDDPIEPDPLYPATVVVSPETGKMEMFGDTLHLTATVRDQNGDVMDSVSVEWSTGDPLVATVTARGVVSARGSGAVGIRATAGAVSDTATVNVDLFQRDALLELYESLNGDDWTEKDNWGTETALGTWHGVVTDEDGNVSTVNLRDNNLSGEIPSEIKLLKHLRILDLSFNDYITGVIPSEIGEMENLTELLLHHNALTGSIPSVITNLTNLVILDFHRNQLTGPLPERLGDLTNLGYLSVWGNELTGSVPASLGDLTGLRSVLIYGTHLSGPLPRTLTNLTLTTFLWQATDLCSPPDDDFQDWLETINYMLGGSPCDQ